MRLNENLELENLKMAEKLKEVLTSTNLNTSHQSIGSHKQKRHHGDSEKFKTPNISKNQNKKILEEDGIKCFDLER